MPEFSLDEYSLVYNAFSFTFAAMFATFIFLVLSRTQVSAKYRPALTMSALVVAIAGYHYFRIFESWEAAFVLNDAADAYIASGTPFNDAYRYIDWLLTVPLLVAELVAVLSLPPRKAGWLTARLAGAAALMVLLGYPGEIADDAGTRALWGTLSTIPFLYIVYALFTELGEAMERLPEQARVLVRNTRLLLFATWGFYPIVYMIPLFDENAFAQAGTIMAVQIGYAVADIAAKCGYGIMIYAIARTKTLAEQAEDAEVSGGAAAPAMAAGD